MGQVKSTIPDTLENLNTVLDDVSQKIAQKEKDLTEEKGNEERNMQSVITLKLALEGLKAASRKLEEYRTI